MSTNKYGRPNRRSNARWSKRAKFIAPRDMTEMKPPYYGGSAFRMGWPCVPPYQMKRRKKQTWIAEWLDEARRRDSNMVARARGGTQMVGHRACSA